MKIEKDCREFIIKLIKEAISSIVNDDKIIQKLSDRMFPLQNPKENSVKQDISLPFFGIAKFILKQTKQKKVKFPEFTSDLTSKIEKFTKTKLESDLKDNAFVSKIEATSSYLNIFLKKSYTSQIITKVLKTSFLGSSFCKSKNENVMIEYSQPNTHKTFHVGHMRNAALGGSLVKLFRYNGYNVVAANYLGDVGTHIAKCLWYYIHQMKNTKIKNEDDSIEYCDIEKDAPKDISKVEWLGSLYINGTNMSDLSQMTKFPYVGYLIGKVISKKPHPQNDHWNIVQIQIDEKPTPTLKTVVCGGTDYDINDLVAYAPPGTRKGARKVVIQDMKGVKSEGIIMGSGEIGFKVKKGSKDIKVFKPDEKTPSGKKIFIGMKLSEVGRNPNEKEMKEKFNVNPEDKVEEICEKRNFEIKEILRKMESGEKVISNLWKVTRQWSIDGFKDIYSWVNCEFDHYFYESDVGDKGKDIAFDAYKKGIFKKSDGAIGVQLGKKLGFAMYISSHGTGLYATKDLALAIMKFNDFKIDRSIYVVDCRQTLHFNQVFKTLELLGFKQAKKCHHLGYEIVKLKDGLMSSRKGNVITFSKLKKRLEEKIYNDFLKKYEGKEGWTKQIIQDSCKKIAVGTIKYGMLNQDNKKVITFDIDEWTNQTGNTGPYLMYAYCRTKSIMREVSIPEKQLNNPNYLVLDHPHESTLIKYLNDFEVIVERATEAYQPQIICVYLYELSKQFSRMYEKVSVKFEKDEIKKAARYNLVKATGEILKKGLDLLGITVVEKM